MLKIGVIGANELAEAHIRLLQELDEFDLVGVHASNEKDLLTISEKCEVKPFTHVDEMLNLIDAVDIVKPTELHFDYASKAIKLSKHVFIEKPVTTTVEEAKQLLGLSEEANVVVQVGHIERFNPAFKAALPYITQPMFIETHRMVKFDAKKAEIPVVLDLMSHDLDIILSLVNSNIKTIRATGVEVVGLTPDIVNAVVEFDNGCIANLTASRISLKNERISKFYQRDAHIKIDYLKQETDLFALKKNGKTEICAKKIEIIEADALKEELKEFSNSIINNIAPEVGIHDGGKMLEVAYQIAEKLKITASLIED
jgi:predicted dehydrogenase